jgi:mannose-6-phosphate isomerase-like protein (cupin superfamily)
LRSASLAWRSEVYCATMQLLAGGCRVFGANEGETAKKGNWTSRILVSKKNGAKYISQTANTYGPGQSPPLVNPRAEEVLYVVSGDGLCHLGGFDYDLHPAVGVYIPPGASYSIENRVAEELLIVSVCCPEDDQRQILATPQEKSGAHNEPPRRIVREQDRQPIPVSDRQFKLLVDEDVGCQRVTQFIGFIPPSKAPFHYHTYEEVVFILEGSGIIHVKEESCEFGPGTSIYLPPSVWHCLENPGPSSVRLLGVFYPSGSPAMAYER